MKYVRQRKTNILQFHLYVDSTKTKSTKQIRDREQRLMAVRAEKMERMDEKVKGIERYKLPVIK